MALQGKAILEFAREKKVSNRIKREIVKRVEHKNDITGLIASVINEGNFHDMILNSKLMPVKQFCEGCLLTDGENNKNLMLVAGSCGVTAQAGNNAYTGPNLKRGSYNSNESGLITGGIRQVWDWSTSQGNGSIASVCLCRHQIGIAEFSDDATEPAEYCDEFLHATTETAIQVDNSLGNCVILDYENNKGYDVYYSNGTITVDVYRVSTTVLHLTDNLYSAELIETHTISQSVNNYSFTTASVSFTGDTIHLLTFAALGNTLNDYAIDISDWSCTVSSHTYSGVRFVGIYDWRTVKLSKDALPIINGYVYALSANSSNVLKMVKCSLTNDADVTEYTYPMASIVNWSEREYYNGPCLILPNGDFYKYFRIGNYGNRGIYYHNGVFYRAKNHIWQPINAASAVAANATNYGVAVFNSFTGLGNAAYYSIANVFPYVSTVANLDEAVIKSADLTMKLTYEITEVVA